MKRGVGGGVITGQCQPSKRVECRKNANDTFPSEGRDPLPMEDRRSHERLILRTVFALEGARLQKPCSSRDCQAPGLIISRWQKKPGLRRTPAIHFREGIQGIGIASAQSTGIIDADNRA